jgi:peptidoglycan/LPS O-acetylase OafA/YrhL
MKKENLDFYLLARFIAAVLVIRQHIEFAYPNFHFLGQSWGWLLLGNDTSGGYAVIFFIFLSAFLISKNFFSGKYKFTLKGILEFYYARAKRIFPLYYFVTFFTLFFVFPYLLETFYLSDNTYRSGLISILTFNYYSGVQWNQVYWAVSIEMAFYAIAPFLLLAQSLVLRNKYITGVAFLASFFGMNYLLAQPFVNSYTALNYFPLILIASLLAKTLHDFDLYSKDNKILSFVKNNIVKLSWFGFGLLYLSLCIPWYEQNISQWMYITPSCIIFTVCVEMYDVARKNNLIKISSGWLQGFINHLGKLSFAIYLTHMLFLFRLNELYANYFLSCFGYLRAKYLMLGLTLTITVVVANFLYNTVEIPGAKWFDDIRSTLSLKFGLIHNWLLSKIK